MNARLPPALSSSLAVFLLVFVVVASVPLSAHAATAPPVPSAPNASGVWEDQDKAIFKIIQAPDSSSISSTFVDDPCSGGPRSTMMAASADGVSMNGTMQRCSPWDSDLVVKCNVTAIWETPFSANLTAEGIVGEYRGEYWVWNTTDDGSWVNCTIDHYYQEPFAFARVDCGIQSFAALADHHISDPSKRAAAITLAESFESGQSLVWTERQLAPGGLKEKVDAFRAALTKWGYTSTVNSAYRPLLYQAHFADLRICALQLRDVILAHPNLASALADSVAAVNAEVEKHRIKFEYYNLSGLSIHVVFVCWEEPLTNCPHTDERAADISIEPDDMRLDWIGYMNGMCRPYLYAKTPDRPHWEYIAPTSPFSNPKCNALGSGGVNLSISGNSPVNLLLETPSGAKLGFDPASGSAVDDFGFGAYYSGPGTHPQVIELPGGMASAGAYSVTGVGTGDGDYTVDYRVTNFDGVDFDGGQVAGHATSGAPISTLNLAVREDYSPASAFSAGTLVSSSGGSTQFAVDKDGGTQTVKAAGGAFTALMYSAQGNVIALKDDGAGGSTRITVPSGLLSPNFTVRSDGELVPVTRTEEASGVTLVFDRPAGGSFITIEGAGPASSAMPPAPQAGFPWVVAGVVAAAAVVTLVFLYRRRGKAPGG